MSSLFNFDVHAHAFHPKISAKVLRQLEHHYHIPPVGTGELSDLLPRLARGGIDRVCIHSAATNAAQVIPANRWALSLQNEPGLIPFGTLHPDYDKMPEELEMLYRKGIKGIKMHPDFQGFRLDAPALLPCFEAMQGKFTLMVHVGDLLPPAQNPSCPYKLAAIKRKFPNLTIIAAHFGGYRHWQYVLQAFEGLRIYLDCSSSLFAIPQALLEDIFRQCPRELLLFGSDYPLFDPYDEMKRLQSRLKLSDTQLCQIMQNANALEFC
ncbi:MAG: amidohydrolase family protein [Oligosphaeraceae bacterium]|mgnify:CR=1 FL=1|nr:amidohydrolase family protein [Oligosphaeraceae bacterium]